MTGAFDVITIGRVGIDLYPLESGIPLEEVETFGRFLGGSATNVAVAAARHGLESAVITRVGKDPFGRYVHNELARLGVSDKYVTEVDKLKTPIVFCEIFPPDDFPLYFYREPKAPDLMIEPHDLDLPAIANARIYWSTVTGLSQEPSRESHHVAWTARGRKDHTILDLDYRSIFWNSPEAAGREIEKALGKVTIAIGNREECQVAVSEVEPHRAADALLERGVGIAVVKMGPGGVMAKSREETVVVPPHKVVVVNGIGAGDGFGGAFCFGLLQGWDLYRILSFANVAGAIVAGRRECSTAMPTTAEVEDALKGASL